MAKKKRRKSPYQHLKANYTRRMIHGKTVKERKAAAWHLADLERQHKGK